jgi:phosphoribosylglycinamide formyltransferase-1
MSRTRIGVLLSGRGSNMQALLQACAAPDYPAEMALVLSNNAGAGGLAYAGDHGVAVEAIDHRPHGKDRQSHERQLDAALRAADVQLICLAGYMRILTPWLIDAWQGKMINIHPSLLPLFPGLHTHQRALDAGMKLHGCTVHQVTAEVDVGPILGQAAVPVLPGDDADRLAARVLRAEHRLYPACLAAFARGEPAKTLDTASLFNPAG